MASCPRRAVVLLVAALVAVLSVVFARAASAYPPGQSGTLGVSTNRTAQGCTITLSGTNFLGTVTFTSEGKSLGTTQADSSGNYTKSIVLSSSDFSVGQHTIVATDRAGDRAEVTVTITAQGNSCQGGGSASGGGGLSDTGIAVVSIGSAGVLLLVAGSVLLGLGRRRGPIATA